MYQTYTVWMALITAGFFSCQRANSIFKNNNIIYVFYIKRILFQLHLVKFKNIWTVYRDKFTLKVRNKTPVFFNVTDHCQMNEIIHEVLDESWYFFFILYLKDNKQNIAFQVFRFKEIHLNIGLYNYTFYVLDNWVASIIIKVSFDEDVGNISY